MVAPVAMNSMCAHAAYILSLLLIFQGLVLSRHGSCFTLVLHKGSFVSFRKGSDNGLSFKCMSAESWAYYPRRTRRDIVLAPSIPSVLIFCLSGTISQYLLVRFDSFFLKMICTINSLYTISFIKIDPLTLSYYPWFSIVNYNSKTILAFCAIIFTCHLLYLTTSIYIP